MYKIRLTDAVQIDTYLILKPEVEMEFDDNTTVEVAMADTMDTLEYVVNTQLEKLAERVAVNEKKAIAIWQNVAVDDRFRTLVMKARKARSINKTDT